MTPQSAKPNRQVALGSALRRAWNFARAHRLNRHLQRGYPCGRCGYRYDCPDGECHS